MTKIVHVLAVAGLLIGGSSFAYGPDDMTPAENLAFRTYVGSIRLEAKVAECKSKLPTWESEYPDATTGWLKRNEKAIRDGDKLFQKLVATAAAEGPRKPTVSTMLADIRKEAVEEIASFSTDHFVTTCINIGNALKLEDREHKNAP